MKPYFMISLLSGGVLALLVLLAIQFHGISKQKIARRATLENMLVVITMYAFATVFFSLIYFWLFIWNLEPLLFTSYTPGSLQQYFLHSLYFSVITLFTVGYGDIVPVGWGRLIAVIEVMIGYALSAALVLTWTQHLRKG